MDSTPAISLSFRQYAEEVRPEIETALAGYAEYAEDCPRRLAEAIAYSLLAPGKRLRPLMVLMACEACGCSRSRAMPAACAVEMIHCYSLIHDDLPAMDDDDLRRGRPTCHKAFDEATAILAGDALLAQAFEVLACDIQPPETAAKMCGELARAAGASALVGGQVADLAAENGEPQTPIDETIDTKSIDQQQINQLENIHKRKTGALFRVSLKLGGLAAGADEKQLAALDLYGRRLGLAFQVIDDLLDLQGDEKSLGKRTGMDSARGKLTFPSLLGVSESRQRAEQLVNDAIAALQPFETKAKSLDALARYVLERNQ